MPIEEQPDGTWKWKDLEIGNEYLLSSRGIFPTMHEEDTYGTFIGEQKGVLVFIEKQDRGFYNYISFDKNPQVIFYGIGGEAGPGSPAVVCQDNGWIPRGKPQEKVKKILEELAIEL